MSRALRGLLQFLAAVRRVPVWLLVGVLRAYQLVVSPLLGPVCRYAPSCSSYAVGAVSTHGAVRGTWLAGRRVLRCHPWAAGGWDPVPPRRPSAGPDAPPTDLTPAPVEPARTS